MELKTGQMFWRDDYSVKLLNIKPMIDAESGKEYYQTDIMIYIDEMAYMRHGFKTVEIPNRTHLTAYMDTLIPEILQQDSN